MPPEPVVVVDDDEGSCELLARLLTRAGYSVARVSSPEQTVSIVEAERPVCVVLALSFGGMSRNFQLLDAIRAASDAAVASTRVVMIAYGTDDPMSPFASQTGADAVIARPFHADELTHAVSGAEGS